MSPGPTIMSMIMTKITESGNESAPSTYIMLESSGQNAVK